MNNLSLDMPQGTPRAYALCVTSTPSWSAAPHLSHALTAQGIAVAHTHLPAEAEMAEKIAHIMAVTQFLRTEQEHQAPCLLIGHSWAGTAVLLAAPHIPESRAIVTIATPAPAPTADELASLRQLRRALLIMHSPLDNSVALHHAQQLYEAALHPKSFISLDKADHELSQAKDARYAGTMLAAWAQNYLELPEPAPEPADEPELVVVRTGREHYRTTIRAAGHTLLADEPLSAGGTDTGPNPYEYLLAALGACSTITMRMYADRKAWPLDTAVVRLTHRKINAEECPDCHTTSGKVDVIEREIELIGDDLTADQRQRIREIADKCPVHRTLHNEIKVRTSLLGSDE
jgi:uncharacterized OsmC-like protein